MTESTSERLCKALDKLEQEELNRLMAENRKRTGIPEPEPAGPCVTSKAQLLTPQDRAHFIREFGGEAYLKLPA